MALYSGMWVFAAGGLAHGFVKAFAARVAPLRLGSRMSRRGVLHMGPDPARLNFQGLTCSLSNYDGYDLVYYPVLGSLDGEGVVASLQSLSNPLAERIAQILNGRQRDEPRWTWSSPWSELTSVILSPGQAHFRKRANGITLHLRPDDVAQTRALLLRHDVAWTEMEKDLRTVSAIARVLAWPHRIDLRLRA